MNRGRHRSAGEASGVNWSSVMELKTRRMMGERRKMVPEEGAERKREQNKADKKDVKLLGEEEEKMEVRKKRGRGLCLRSPHGASLTITQTFTYFKQTVAGQSRELEVLQRAHLPSRPRRVGLHLLHSDHSAARRPD